MAASRKVRSKSGVWEPEKYSIFSQSRRALEKSTDECIITQIFFSEHNVNCKFKNFFLRRFVCLFLHIIGCEEVINLLHSTIYLILLKAFQSNFVSLYKPIGPTTYILRMELPFMPCRDLMF